MVHVLQNFLKVVQGAMELDPSNFEHTSDEEMKVLLGMMEQEQVELPPGLQYRLIMRHIQKLIAERKFLELLHSLDPFSTQPFSVSQPSIAGLGAGQGEQKLQVFKRIIFQELLAKFIVEGAAGKDKVYELCMACLAKFKDVDDLFLENGPAVVLHAARSVWTGLVALTSASVSADALDTSDKSVLFCDPPSQGKPSKSLW
eukprot:6468159-Amphidinium_carterae.5